MNLVNPLPTVHRLPQILPRPELHSLVSGYGDAFPGARVTSFAGGNVHDFEHAEALNFQGTMFHDAFLEHVQHMADDTIGLLD